MTRAQLRRRLRPYVREGLPWFTMAAVGCAVAILAEIGGMFG